MQGWHCGKGLIYYRPVTYIYALHGPDCIQTVFFIFSIFTLSNLGDSSNLISSLSQTRTVNSKFRAFCLAPITFIVKLYMAEDPENHTLFSSTYPPKPNRGEPLPLPFPKRTTNSVSIIKNGTKFLLLVSLLLFYNHLYNISFIFFIILNKLCRCHVNSFFSI